MKKTITMFKAFVCILFIFFLQFCLFSQELGDVNGDTVVNIVDALVTAQYSVGLNPVVFLIAYADVDGNGNINIIDALMIAQYYVGLIREFPGQGNTQAPTPSPTRIPTRTPGGSAKKIIGYFTSWGIYNKAFYVTDIPFAHITHINYAFANIVNGGIALGDEWADTGYQYPGDTWDQPLAGNFYQLNFVQKQNFPHYKTLISVGGWTWSGQFSDVAFTNASRKKFADSCAAFAGQYGFDGVDIDWEYPDGGGLSGNTERPEDPANFILLMAALRSSLDTQGRLDGKYYFLTAATSAGIWHINNINWSALNPYVDWINLMTYDFHGAWDSTTNHHSNLYAFPADPNSEQLNCDTVVQAYIAAGIPPAKLNLGIPFYGRAWGQVAVTNNGLCQSGTNSVSGSQGEQGYYDYSDIANLGYTEYWDNAAKVPWSYNSAARIFITYDNPASIQIKGDYVNARGLGGMMCWEFSGDKTFALLDAVYFCMSR